MIPETSLRVRPYPAAVASYATPNVFTQTAGSSAHDR